MVSRTPCVGTCTKSEWLHSWFCHIAQMLVKHSVAKVLACKLPNPAALDEAYPCCSAPLSWLNNTWLHVTKDLPIGTFPRTRHKSVEWAKLSARTSVGTDAAYIIPFQCKLQAMAENLVCTVFTSSSLSNELHRASGTTPLPAFLPLNQRQCYDLFHVYFFYFFLRIQTQCQKLILIISNIRV